MGTWAAEPPLLSESPLWAWGRACGQELLCIWPHRLVAFWYFWEKVLRVFVRLLYFFKLSNKHLRWLTFTFYQGRWKFQIREVRWCRPACVNQGTNNASFYLMQIPVILKVRPIHGHPISTSQYSGVWTFPVPPEQECPIIRLPWTTVEGEEWSWAKHKLHSH